MKMTTIARVARALGAGACLSMASQAQAANWLMLQGTEPAGSSQRVDIWGFVQAKWEKDYSDPYVNGAGQELYIPPKLLGPDLDSQEGFQVNRARLGARGTGFPLDDKVNYFLLAEFGNNGITYADGGSGRLTDASITLNYIPHARIRVGLFKYPGAEEGLQAIHVFDYINFTEVTNQLMLERFPNQHYTANANPVTLPVDDSNGGLNQFDDPVGAFRDVGVQVFDAFRTGRWEHSYAAMIGNGNGLNYSNSDDEYDTYLYWSSELVFGGQGPRREGLKLFVWNQDGKRLLDQTDDGTWNPKKYDRERRGLGAKYLRNGLRLAGEYMQGKGMIFVGPDKPTFDQNGYSAADPEAANGADGEAYGYYLDAGWRIPSSKWDVDLRYDEYHRLSDDPGPATGANAGRSFESVWKTWTLGVQYHFNLKTRATLNYAIRDVRSPDWESSSLAGNPDEQMKGIGNRLGVQLTHIF